MIPQSLITITVERRDYGRRYSNLPVDQIDGTGFIIDCSAAYTRPTHYDLRMGDTVRWQQNEQVIEATIASVERSNEQVAVILAGAHPLPTDFFYY